MLHKQHEARQICNGLAQINCAGTRKADTYNAHEAMLPKGTRPMSTLARLRRFDPVPVMMMSVGVLLGAVMVWAF